MNMRLNKLLMTSKSINKSKNLMSKSRGEWESIKLFPRDFADEHEELTSDDYVNEVFDDNYYHFFHKEATPHNEQLLDDHFHHQRMWYHWYINPEKISTEYEYGNSVVKTVFRCLPFLLFVYFCYIQPSSNRKKFGKNNPSVRPIII